MSWTHLEDRTPIAAKPHRCVLCDRWVEKGERHVLRVGVVDGDLCRSRMHSRCEAITRDWDEDSWECTDPTEFRDMLDELAQAAPAEGGAS